MAQRISRAKRTVSEAGIDRPGDVGTVMRVLYLVFNEGYSGDVDLAAEAIRLTRQLAALVDDPEVHGLLALMLLHHARRRSRTRPDGSIVPLAEQDRSQWDRDLIAEGIVIAQAALGARPARRVPGAGGDRRAPRRRAERRGDRLDPDRGVVRRAAPLRRHADRPAQPRRRGRGGRRRAGRAGGAGRGRRRRPAARARSPPTSTRRTATSSWPPASTPTPPATPPTSPSATTRRARPPGSTSGCGIPDLTWSGVSARSSSTRLSGVGEGREVAAPRRARARRRGGRGSGGP